MTRGFKKTIQERVRSDAAFRKELLCEGVEFLLSGDLETGKAAPSSCFIEEPLQARIFELTVRVANIAPAGCGKSGKIPVGSD